jgi:hypothetical protein
MTITPATAVPASATVQATCGVTQVWFLRRVLNDKPLYRPPYQQTDDPREIVSTAGDPGPVAADRYACPEDDYVWYRPDVGTPVPACPTHRVKLTRR